MKHTETYILDRLKIISQKIIKENIEGNAPKWVLKIQDLDTCLEKNYVLYKIAEGVLGGSTEGAVIEFDDDNVFQDSIIWNLKINWRLKKPAFIFFNELEIENILADF